MHFLDARSIEGHIFATYVRWVAEPIFQLLRPLPPLAWIPLAIIWLGIGDISRIAFGVINAFNTGGAVVSSITPLAITDLMPPTTSPYNATFASLTGEFQFGAALVERGLAGSPFTGGPVQFARFRITFSTLPPGSRVNVYIGDAGPGSFSVRSASGADLSGDATADGTPLHGTAGFDQGPGAGIGYVDGQITVQ